jgi:hypothetical protein
MAEYIPELHQVSNELDDFGLLLDLKRLEEENNRSYKQRLFDVFVNRANSSYTGLINGITRELGLSVYHAMTVSPTWDGANIKGDNPAIVFDETKCYVYSDYTSASGLEVTIDRYDRSGSWTLGELVSAINATGYMYAALQSGVSSTTRAMCIFNQKSIDVVTSEDLATGSVIVNLEHDNLFSDSVSVTSSNLFERVGSQIELVKSGQYYIDYDLGILYTVEAPEAGSVIRYEYRDDNFEVMASPVIIHNLQSSDFKKKMFEQILTEDGTYTNGAATALGADLISELMSVFNLSYAP